MWHHWRCRVVYAMRSAAAAASAGAQAMNWWTAQYALHRCRPMEAGAIGGSVVWWACPRGCHDNSRCPVLRASSEIQRQQRACAAAYCIWLSSVDEGCIPISYCDFTITSDSEARSLMVSRLFAFIVSISLILTSASNSNSNARQGRTAP